jgi:hypothetical protein
MCYSVPAKSKILIVRSKIVIFYVCCFVDSCLSFFSCPLCTLSFDLRILITFWYLTTLRMPVRPHNPWWHHEGNHIVVDTHYYNTTHNTTYSVVSCGRLSSAFSLMWSHWHKNSFLRYQKVIRIRKSKVRVHNGQEKKDKQLSTKQHT